MAKDMKILRRSEMDPAFCWNTADLYPDDQAWTAAFEAARALPEEIAAWQGRLGESAEALYAYLCRVEEINRQGTTVIVVTHNREIVDQMQKRVIAMKSGKIVSDEEKGGYTHED